MTISSLSISNPTNLHNLALFICHLFIDGHFRFGHNLYDPKVFDGQLTTEIDSICPVQIPWQTTDITQSPSLPSRENDRTDHVLQLIFFDPKYLTDQIDQYKDQFTFYRIFVFPSTTDEIDSKKRIGAISELNPVFSSSSLIMQYNSENGLIAIDLVSEHGGSIDNSEQRVYYRDVKGVDGEEQELSVQYNHLFDQTFGKYERMRSIGIRVPMWFRRIEDATDFKTHLPHMGFDFLANHLSSTLHPSYINMTFKIYDNISYEWKNGVWYHKPRKYYSELSFEYESIADETSVKLRKSHSIELHLSAYLLSTPNAEGTQIYPMYPHQSHKLAVIFVYGTDFQREMSILVIPNSTLLLLILIVLFMCLAAAILCFIRRRFKLRRDGLISTLIDAMVTFTAGGNLQMRHKFERWFFGILLIAAFFITSIYTGDLLNSVYRMQDLKIDTFERLATINSTLYMNPTLNVHAKNICEMLRSKMGSDVNYGGLGLALHLVPHHNETFIYVVEAYRLDGYRLILMNHKRDFDILSESLGDVSSPFYVSSDHYVSVRMLTSIDQITSSMMENGLQKFYKSFTAFKRNFLERDDLNREDEDFRALTMDQLKRPMQILFLLWGIATIVWIVEAVVLKCKNWYDRNRNQ